MEIKLCIEGAIFGSFIGNALGYRCLDKKLTRTTISQQLARQYSEAGAMSLCTMVSLIDSERLDTEDMANRFHEWYIGGYMAASEKIQGRINVSQALRLYINGMPPDRCGSKEIPADNSALMRMLPLALWNASEPISTIVSDAHEATKFTNQQIEAQVCSALYCLLIRRFLLEQTYKISDILSIFYAEKDMKEHIKILNNFQETCNNSKPQGKSDAFNSFWSASSIFAKNDKNFENAISQAIMLGNDCEVTSYLVGSLSGIILGVNDIPQRWLNQLDLSNEAKKVITSFVQVVKKKLI